MLPRPLFLLALVLFSSQAFAQENQVADAGYILCPTGQQYVYLYQSLTNFEVLASPKCGDKVEVLGRENTLGGYLRVRTADGKEGYVPQLHFTATPPASPRITIQQPQSQSQSQPQRLPAASGTASRSPASSPSFGSDVPLAEVFGGYSYLSADADIEGLGSRSAFHGANASAAININRWLGLEADFGGHYKRDCAGTSGLTCRQLTFMGGPRVTYREGKVSAFGHGLFGMGNLSASLPGGSSSETKLAWAAGGGFELAVSEHVSVRVGQVDYLITRYTQTGATHQDHIRLSAGVVFKLGRIITE